ncbi:succinate dehydrogenase cytochrome b558 subunit [Paenibacillus thermotolerans]|uniref:succinate dehydrogenase cytochrome b558 subunit n=1 Tax=Paenibacillus thermotolerans TaxID=3027807 RepID=UPI002367E830|nr:MULTISPECIES: succinate dehydrogenase cytochrome b558 subunit [unclassified Paenibacillus]
MKGNSYLHRKLHSLLGVLPLGGFFVEHLLTNYSAYQGGPERFLEHVHWIHSLPLVFFLELFLIWLPLLYHGVYGLYVAYQSRNNVSNHGYFRNWMFMLQRVTGVITFVFVVWHVWNTRVQIALGSVEQDAIGTQMHSIVTNPVIFGIYIVCIIAAVFHFSNGLWSFLVSWGIVVGPRAQRVTTYVTMGLFVVMSIMFILSLTAFLDDSFAAAASETASAVIGAASV